MFLLFFAKEAELNRSKERAVPYLVDSLRLFAGKPQGDRIMDYMVEMNEDMVTPMLEIFKVPFPEPGVRLIRQVDVDFFTRQMAEFREELQLAVTDLDGEYYRLKKNPNT